MINERVSLLERLVVDQTLELRALGAQKLALEEQYGKLFSTLLNAAEVSDPQPSVVMLEQRVRQLVEERHRIEAVSIHHVNAWKAACKQRDDLADLVKALRKEAGELRERIGVLENDGDSIDVLARDCEWHSLIEQVPVVGSVALVIVQHRMKTGSKFVTLVAKVEANKFRNMDDGREIRRNCVRLWSYLPVASLVLAFKNSKPRTGDEGGE